jgi:mono/diheme cytochrome c family protein
MPAIIDRSELEHVSLQYLKEAVANNESRQRARCTTSATASAANSKTRELYAKNCAVCHRPNGEGGTVKLEDQKLKVPSLKSGRARRHSDESMIDQILKGG